jgi:hypothetical protein
MLPNFRGLSISLLEQGSQFALLLWQVHFHIDEDSLLILQSFS